MRVVLSPPELESVADLLHDSEHRVVSVKRQALSSLDSIEAVPAGAFGTAAGEIQQAVNILDQVTGTGAGGLHNLVATLFHDEMFVRRCRDEALLADRPSVTLTSAQRQLLQVLAKKGRTDRHGQSQRPGQGHGVTVVG
jgi:hypothetical protein